MKVYRNNTPMSSWLSDFADKVSTGTQPANRVVDFTSQISGIMNGTRRDIPYSTVAEAVDYYKKIIGLSEVSGREIVADIMSEASDESDKKKDDFPEVLNKCESIGPYVSNLIRSHIGIQLPAIINSVLSTFNRFIDESDLDESFMRYVNGLLADAYVPSANISSNIGNFQEFDNGDFFSDDNPLGFLQNSKGK